MHYVSELLCYTSGHKLTAWEPFSFLETIHIPSLNLYVYYVCVCKNLDEAHHAVSLIITTITYCGGRMGLILQN